MNIRCPHCQTVFRVDPARIPDHGVRARCARCTGTFRVEQPAAGASPPDSGRRPAPTAGTAASSRGADGSGGRTAAAAPQERQTPAWSGATQGPARTAMSAPPPTAGEPAREGQRRPSFGRTDPDARAQRIARALVSDIVAYHPEKVDASVRAGTLRGDFREEIMKSWDEYVAQVGAERAKSTPFFRNALNDILARGQQLF